jgi:hypothetical protein
MQYAYYEHTACFLQVEDDMASDLKAAQTFANRVAGAAN